MTQEAMKDLREKMNALLTIQRAPSQFAILSHLLSTRRSMTVKELSAELNLTPKATERAMAKLLEKGLIQRTPFREGGYACDSNLILLSLLLATSEIYEKLSRMKATSEA